MDDRLVRRCVRYGVKLSHGWACRSKKVPAEVQFEHYCLAQAHLADVSGAARAVFCRMGVQPMMFAMYTAFVLQADKKLRRLAGNQRWRELQLVYRAWKARGLRADVLAAVLAEVFELDGAQVASIVGGAEL